ncbi:unnamed protein product [Menidia menidia]|uniref:Protein sprouty homolog 1 n=1 Tax=Menidia menidia TaxID=238744 RepID=A0A8S4BSQ4_9TELE|nr:unnamed protein product [Menidia menidia]
MDLQTPSGPGGPLAVVQQQPSLNGRRQRSDYYERELQHILSLEQIKAIRSSNEYTEGPSVANRRPRNTTTNPRDKQERTHEVILVNVNNNYEPGNPLNALNPLNSHHTQHSQHSQPGLSRSTSSGSASSGSSGSSEQGLLAGGRPPHHRNHHNHHHRGPTGPQPPNHQHNHQQHNQHNQQQNNRNQKYRNVPVRTQPQPKAISHSFQSPVGDLVKTPGNGKSLESPGIGNGKSVESLGMPLGSAGHQFICERCAKCKCADCTAPRSLPSCLACGGQCLCSAQSALEHGTCMCLVKGLFYHCSGEDHDDQGDSCADQPCSLSRAHCCSRFLCMGLMAVLFPCLLCYPPVKACLRAAQGLYDRALRPGCRHE